LLRELRLAALEQDPDAFESPRPREAGLHSSERRDRTQRSAIAFMAGVPVGLIGWFHPDDDETRLEIVSMWVRPDARRRGVAAELIRFVDENIKTTSGASLELGVMAANQSARAAYQRLGFMAVGTDRGIFTGRQIIRMQRGADALWCRLDGHYTDRRLTCLYDRVCAGRPDFAFYLPLVMSARSVLDIGCGTGELLRVAREAGHRGDLCGLDPADPMLEHARVRTDIDWVVGTLASLRTDRRFDLVTMTGHAFQVLLTDDDIASALEAVKALLTDDGQFAFETRNPLAREWEKWTPEHPTTVLDNLNNEVSVTSDVTAVQGDLVTFTMTFASNSWRQPLTSTSTLRFIDIDTLKRYLAHAGLTVHAQFGDWDHQPFTSTSPEIITLCS
jgi:ubiquinone/menaquinone biosynthesis C-methylase UbiE/RimJ/RimL family protein N-acetyltransferase